MSLEGNKSQASSLTIQGLIVPLVIQVLNLADKYFALNLGQDDITQFVAAIATLVGIAIAWYGRIRATQKIK